MYLEKNNNLKVHFIDLVTQSVNFDEHKSKLLEMLKSNNIYLLAAILKNFDKIIGLHNNAEELYIEKFSDILYSKKEE